MLFVNIVLTKHFFSYTDAFWFDEIYFLLLLRVRNKWIADKFSKPRTASQNRYFFFYQEMKINEFHHIYNACISKHVLFKLSRVVSFKFWIIWHKIKTSTCYIYIIHRTWQGSIHTNPKRWQKVKRFFLRRGLIIMQLVWRAINLVATI